MVRAPHALVVILLAAGTGDAPAPPIPHHPHDVIDDVALVPNYGERPTVFVASSGTMRLFLRSDNGGHTWVSARNGMRGAELFEFEVAPDWKQSSAIYAVLGRSGLQRSTDGGQSWEVLAKGYWIHVALAPTAPDGRQTLFYASGTAIRRSDDGGASSTHVLGNLPAESSITTVAVSPGYWTDKTVVVGTRDKRVLFSHDAGKTWRGTEVSGVPQRVALSPQFATDATLWVATHGAGVIKTTDAGINFAPSSAGMDDADANDIVVAPGYPNCRDLFVATRDRGVYRSRDGGESWELTALDVKRTPQTDNHFKRLALSSGYPDDPTVYCGSFEGLFFSHDAGGHWFESNVSPTRIGRHLKLSPNFEHDGTAFAATYGNPLIKTNNRGDTWQPANTNFRGVSSYSVGVSPTYADQPLVLVGVIGGVRRSEDGGQTWEATPYQQAVKKERYVNYQTRDILFSPDFATDQVVFAVDSGGFYRSEDAGRTWSSHAVPTELCWELELSPQWTRDHIVFAGGVAIHRSEDDGATWSGPLYEDRILDIVCPPDFSATGEVYALTRGAGFARSTDHGVTWTPMPGAWDGYTGECIRLSPTFAEDNTILVSTIGGGFYVSRDRGVSWQRWHALGSPVDSCFVFDLSPAFARDRTILAGTFEGFWRSEDGGASWRLVTDEEFYDEDRAPWMLLGGSWEDDYSGDAYCRKAQRAGTKGHLARLPFTGTGIRLFGKRGPDQGIAEVQIDGETVARVDLYSASPESQQVVFESDDLAWGVHDLTVAVTGDNNPSSSNTWVSLDGASVLYRDHGEAETPVISPVLRALSGMGIPDDVVTEPIEQADTAGLSTSTVLLGLALVAFGIAVVWALSRRR